MPRGASWKLRTRPLVAPNSAVVLVSARVAGGEVAAAGALVLSSAARANGIAARLAHKRMVRCFILVILTLGLQSFDDIAVAGGTGWGSRIAGGGRFRRFSGLSRLLGRS